MMMKKLLQLAAILAVTPQVVLAEVATPPAIAYQACADLQAGDVVEFSTKADGDFVGICQVVDGKLVALPVTAPPAKPKPVEASNQSEVLEPTK